MQTPKEMANEAVLCRASGDQYGYGQYLQELEAAGLSSTKIRKLLDEAEQRDSGLADVVSSGARDPRMPIPESEWPRPRYGFAR